MASLLKDTDPVSGLARYRIRSPHPAEIPIPQREYLDFYATPPAGGINADTVPVLVLPALGDFANSEYMASLHRSFSAKRNWLTLTVNHLGAIAFRFENLSPRFEAWNEEVVNRMHHKKGLPPVPFEEMRKGNFIENVFRYLQNLPAHLNTKESPLMALTLLPAPGEHFDGGLIQAMDCLWAIRAMQNEYPDIRWSRLTVAGSSHGGYLATLLAKLAPNTFSLVINADGYIRIQIATMLKDLAHFATREVHGVYCHLYRDNYWTMAPTSPFYLSEDRQLIRLLANEEGQLEQWRRQQLSKKPLFVFTQTTDDITHPRAEKELLVRQMRKLDFTLEYYDQPDSRHRVLEQGLEKSLKGLVYDFLTEERLEKAGFNQADDFLLKSKITYQCFKGRYRIDYSGEFPLCSYNFKYL